MLIGFALLCSCAGPPEVHDGGTHDVASALDAPGQAETRGGALIDGAVPASPPEDPPAKVVLGDGLTIEEAERLCLWLNPRLRLARLEAAVPKAGAVYAGDWNDPELEVEALANTGDVDEALVLGIGVTFSLPVTGSKRAAARAALAAYDVATWRAVVEERAELTALRRDWLRWSYGARTLTLLEASEARAREVHEIAARMVEGGALQQTEANVLAIALAELAGEVAAAKARQQARRLAILARVGLRASASVRLEPATAGPVAPEDEAAERLTRHPRVQWLLAKATRSGLERARALADALPAIAVGPVYEREGGEDKIGVSLSTPLPVWNANRREAAEAAAAQRAARLAVVGRYQQLLADHARARHELASARARLAHLKTKVEPLAKRQVEALRLAAEAGVVNALLSAEALEKRREVERQVVAAEQAVALASVELHGLLEGGRR